MKIDLASAFEQLPKSGLQWQITGFTMDVVPKAKGTLGTSHSNFNYGFQPGHFFEHFLYHCVFFLLVFKQNGIRGVWPHMGFWHQGGVAA